MNKPTYNQCRHMTNFPSILLLVASISLLYIRVTQSINLRTSSLKPLRHLIRRCISLRYNNPPLHSLADLDFIHPPLQRRPFGQVNLQRSRADLYPCIVRNIGNGILRTSQVWALLEPRGKYRVETLCLVDIPLDGVVGARVGEEPEVLSLALNTSA